MNRIDAQGIEANTPNFPFKIWSKANSPVHAPKHHINSPT